MKKFFYLFISIAMLTSNTELLAAPEDSLRASQIRSERRLITIEQTLQRLSKTNDSLTKELFYFRAKEDFYVMAVERQASHMEWLIALIVAGASLLSFSIFNRSFENLRQKVEKRLALIESESKEHGVTLKRTRMGIYSTLSSIVNNLTPMPLLDQANKNMQNLTMAYKRYCTSVDFAHRSYLLLDEENKKDIAISIIKAPLTNVSRLQSRINKYIADPKNITHKDAVLKLLEERGNPYNPLMKKIAAMDDEDLSSTAISILNEHNRLISQIVKNP